MPIFVSVIYFRFDCLGKPWRIMGHRNLPMVTGEVCMINRVSTAGFLLDNHIQLNCLSSNH